MPRNWIKSSLEPQCLGNIDPLDLIGAAGDAEVAGDAKNFLDARFLHQTMSAVELHGTVGNTIQRFITEDLECTHRLNQMRLNLQGPQITLVSLPQALKRHAAHGLHIEIGIHDHPLQRLETTQRPAESLAISDVRYTAIKQILPQAGTHAAAPHADPVDHSHTQVKSLAFLTPRVF